jgi:putative transposase
LHRIYRNYQLLTVADPFNRECIALEVAYGFRSMDVINALRRAMTRRGKPQVLHCDNGSEFASTEFGQWAYWDSIAIDFSRPEHQVVPRGKKGRHFNRAALFVRVLKLL